MGATWRWIGVTRPERPLTRDNDLPLTLHSPPLSRLIASLQAIASLRQFLLNMLKPIRASVKTNIHIIQSSILLKYLPFFHFLKRQAPKIAQEVQRAYVVSARAYYETCFRRYARSLAQIAVSRVFSTVLLCSNPAQARSPEYASPIGTPSAAEIAAQTLLLNRTLANRGGPHDGSTAVPGADASSTADRLRFAKLMDDDIKVVPGYAADDRAYVSAVSRRRPLELIPSRRCRKPRWKRSSVRCL